MLTRSIPRSKVAGWYVDGVEVKDFNRDGTKLVINSDIPLAARVDIHYQFGN